LSTRLAGASRKWRHNPQGPTEINQYQCHEVAMSD
jgi:hypothetical protein